MVLIEEMIPITDLSQVLMNPVRSRILRHLAIHQTATAGDLAEKLTDVPRTTLYRHLNVLAKHNVIKVVAENRVRGSVERTYSLNVEAMQAENTVANATRNAFGFLMKIYGDLHNYFSSPSNDPAADRIFLSNVTLLLSDEEFGDLLAKINAIFLQHIDNQPTEDRKTRSLAIISSPVFDEGR